MVVIRPDDSACTPAAVAGKNRRIDRRRPSIGRDLPVTAVDLFYTSRVGRRSIAASTGEQAPDRAEDDREQQAGVPDTRQEEAGVEGRERPDQADVPAHVGA